jgi:nucleotide-binding universal stress UspA family protein
MVAEVVAGWTEKYPDTTIIRRPVHHMNPAWSLMEESREACLLVVGSRGRGGFARLLLGSVSRELVTHAYCPVAVVPERS